MTCKMKTISKSFGLGLLLLGSLIGCDGCRKDEFEVFNRVFPPCDVCTAVKIVNTKSGSQVSLGDTIQTLRNVADSLVIRRNGTAVVTLPNFKQDMANRKNRIYFFKSTSEAGVKSIRFRLTGSADTPLITSNLIDGQYSASKDTLDIYYNQP